MKKGDCSQPILYVDQLDGTAKPQSVAMGVTQLIFNAFYLSNPSIQPVPGDPDKYNLFFNMEIFLRELSPITNNDHRQMKFYLDLIEQNQVLQHCCFAYATYLTGKPKHYLLSNNLRELLERPALNIKTEMIPPNLNFYMEVKGLVEDFEGDRVLGVFVNTIPQEGIPTLMMAMLVGEGEGKNLIVSHRSVFLDLSQDETVWDSYKKHQFHATYASRNDPKIAGRYEDEITLRTLLNAVLYIAHGCEPFDELQNIFSTKKKKLAIQQKLYTPKPFIFLGKDVEKLRVVPQGTSYVAPYPRWQRYGPNNSRCKLVMVAEKTGGFERKYNLYKGELQKEVQ